MSKFLSLNQQDFIKGLIVFVLAASFTWLAQTFDAPGFDFATFRWDELFRIASVAAMSYIGKNLLSDSNGKVLGMV